MFGSIKLHVCLLALFCLALLSGCSESFIWHEKITVVMDTPNGKIEASSVYRTGIGRPDILFTNSDRRFLQGEAITIELPDENGKPRYLFALLKGFSSYYQFHKKVFRAREKHPKDFLGHSPRVMPVKSYPLLVVFEDLNKPETVKQVKPEEIATVFGEGYNLEAMTVQITDEEVTTGRVEQILGWFGALDGKLLDGRQFSTIKAENRLANNLSKGNFVRTRKKQ